MAKNRGKKFEDIVKQAFERVPEVSVDRLHDQTTGYLGASNICDFIVYRKPFEYYIECKSVHGNTLSIHSIPKADKSGVLHGFYGNITDTQWDGLLEKSKIPGVTAGVMCWWVDKDVTLFLPIQILVDAREMGHKSVRYDFNFGKVVMGDDFRIAKTIRVVPVIGTKKRVFFDYDMEQFLKEVGE